MNHKFEVGELFDYYTIITPSGGIKAFHGVVIKHYGYGYLIEKLKVYDDSWGAVNSRQDLHAEHRMHRVCPLELLAETAE